MHDRPLPTLSKQPSHKTDALFPAYKVTIREKLFIGQHCAVSAENNLCSWRMAAYELCHPPELVKGGNNKIDTDVVVSAVLEFPDKLPLRRVVEDNRRGFDVFSNIVKPPTADYLPVTEYALFPSDLRMEELGSHRIAFAVPAERPADSGEQDMWFLHACVLLNMMKQHTPNCLEVDSIT
jgi:hypothetical protein